MPSLFKKSAATPATSAEAAATDGTGVATDDVRGIADRYVTAPPSAQNAIDLFDGTWTSSLPPHLGLHAGALPTFTDTRIQAVLEHLNSIKGYKVLELGPMEGGHTHMLHEAGASVTAIEASSRSFLKCLVVKEILHLNRAHFHLGDFLPYLDSTKDRFDLVVASGVLYHTIDPLKLLERIAALSDKLAIWTHYWREAAIADDPVLAPLFAGGATSVEWRGHTFTMHAREYPEAFAWTGFCGGPETRAFWMERDDLLTALADLGYGVTVLDDQPDGSNGPSILLCAER